MSQTNQVNQSNQVNQTDQIVHTQKLDDVSLKLFNATNHLLAAADCMNNIPGGDKPALAIGNIALVITKIMGNQAIEINQKGLTPDAQKEIMDKINQIKIDLPEGL